MLTFFVELATATVGLLFGVTLLNLTLVGLALIVVDARVTRQLARDLHMRIAHASVQLVVAEEVCILLWHVAPKV